MNNSKQLIGAILISVALAFVWILDLPAFHKVTAYRQAIGDHTATLSQKQQILKSIQDLNAEAKSKISDPQKFTAVVPTKKDSAELISALDKIAANSGISISEVSISSTVGNNKEETARLNISLKLSGTYNGMLVFLDNIERNVRLLDITTAELNTDILSPGQLNAKLVMNAYFLK